MRVEIKAVKMTLATLMIALLFNSLTPRLPLNLDHQGLAVLL
jgi:hypothetical protein